MIHLDRPRGQEVMSLERASVIPSTRHHQFDLDPVGHQDPQDLLVGDVLHTETQEGRGHVTADTPVDTPVV